MDGIWIKNFRQPRLIGKGYIHRSRQFRLGIGPQINDTHADRPQTGGPGSNSNDRPPGIGKRGAGQQNEKEDEGAVSVLHGKRPIQVA